MDVKLPHLFDIFNGLVTNDETNGIILLVASNSNVGKNFKPQVYYTLDWSVFF